MSEVEMNIDEAPTTIGDVMKSWYHGIQPLTSNESGDDYDGDTADFIYVQYKPKWKWFRPPFSIKIWKWEISFMWAYNVYKAYQLKDCYPIGMSTSTDEQELELSFNCNKVENDKVTELSEILKNTMKSMKDNEEE